MNNELKTLNDNVNTKLDGIVTSIIEKSPTSSIFKTPDSEGFISNISNFNNDIKSNMNDSINELKNYIREIIETKISENLNNSNNNSNSDSNKNYNNEEESQKQTAIINNTLNELKGNIETMNSNHNHMINELMTRIANENDNRIREMEERFNQKLEALTNIQNRFNEANNVEEQAEQTQYMLENMANSIKELKNTINAKNSEIEKLKDMTEQMNKNTSVLASNNNKSKDDDERLKYMEFTKTLEEDIKQHLRKFKKDICSSISSNNENIDNEENDDVVTPTPDNVNKKENMFKDDQDTIDYVKQIRDNVDRQLLEFKMAINDLSDNINHSKTISSSNSNGFNPEMIETIRSFRSEIKSQYQDFCDMMKDILIKQQENNKKEKDFPSNKIIKDNSMFYSYI